MFDAQPVSTYEQALWWLVRKSAQGATIEQLTFAVQLIADTYWFSPAKVTHDWQKVERQIPAAEAAAPRRRGR